MTSHKRSSTIISLNVLLHVLVLVYQVDSLLATRLRGSNNALDLATYVGVNKLLGPEDIAYDKKSGVIYTGCADGTIRKVYIGLPYVKNILKPKMDILVNTTGRPFGIALDVHGNLFVADAYKGLVSVSTKGAVTLLTDKAEGLRFNLTSGVDVANNGVIYFTDASFKYGLPDRQLEELPGTKPHGRFMSYDPVSRKTTVLVRNIYFANGVLVTPNQRCVIFCEANRRRCRKYHIRGPKIGLTENFIDNLPGAPVNIRYDGEGHYWIGIFKKNGTSGGILATNLKGQTIAYYTDTNLSLTGGNKIGNHIYCCSLSYPYLIRLDLTIL